MFAECWTRKLDTAYTIPGLSGQDSVSTYSRPRAAFMTHLRVMMLHTMQHHLIYASTIAYQAAAVKERMPRGVHTKIRCSLTPSVVLYGPPTSTGQVRYRPHRQPWASVDRESDPDWEFRAAAQLEP